MLIHVDVRVILYFAVEKFYFKMLCLKNFENHTPSSFCLCSHPQQPSNSYRMVRPQSMFSSCDLWEPTFSPILDFLSSNLQVA